MTPERAKELLPIIQAYAEGKQVQVKHPTRECTWVDLTEPSFNSPTDCYRIKPEKKVAYLNIYGKGYCGNLNATAEDAQRYCNSAKAKARVRIEYEEGQFDD